MKKFLSVLMAAGLVLGFAGTASAEKPADAGPGDNNQKGLCTAYFNGQKNGHDKNADPRPFADLETAGTTYDGENGDNTEDLSDEQQVSDDVYEYCQQFGIGGNPEHNGRFDCSEESGDKKSGPPRDSDTDGEVECTVQD